MAVGTAVSVSTAITYRAFRALARRRQLREAAARNLTLEAKRFQTLNLTEWVEERYSQEYHTFSRLRRARLGSFYYFMCVRVCVVCALALSVLGVLVG